MRYWKSQPLTYGRMTAHNLLSLGGGHVSVISHGDVTKVQQNHAPAIREVAAPNYEVMPEVAKIVDVNARKLLRLQGSDIYHAHACITPDVTPPNQTYYSLDARIFSAPEAPTIIFAQPGKMTTSPEVAQDVVRVAISDVPYDGANYALAALGHRPNTIPTISQYPHVLAKTL